VSMISRNRTLSPGPVPPTNRQRMIKRPDRLPGDQASDLNLLVAGAGFEPATLGYERRWHWSALFGTR
jgi:hypothetical protein